MILACWFAVEITVIASHFGRLPTSRKSVSRLSPKVQSLGDPNQQPQHITSLRRV